MSTITTKRTKFAKFFALFTALAIVITTGAFTSTASAAEVAVADEFVAEGHTVTGGSSPLAPLATQHITVTVDFGAPVDIIDEDLIGVTLANRNMLDGPYQRRVTVAIKHARHLALMPFVARV